MNYYLLRHKINQDDIYVNIEQQGPLELLSEGKTPKISKIYYEGKNSTDYISLGGFGVSYNAMSFFKRECGENVNFIPTVIYGKDTNEPLNIYLMKVNIELDCVDYEKSELFVLSDKNIRGIDKMVLKIGINKEIFTIKNLLFSITVSENIKNKMIDLGLKGFDYIPIEKFTF
ncbi:imm11 family protein [Chryseobacterium sp. sg2396]|uniref:imm11 family protein n=1 Tax=Chryseobacterium sp. sg2396 TaxID=3276280 RepID=UPI00366CE776